MHVIKVHTLQSAKGFVLILLEHLICGLLTLRFVPRGFHTVTLHVQKQRIMKKLRRGLYPTMDEQRPNMKEKVFITHNSIGVIMKYS